VALALARGGNAAEDFAQSAVKFSGHAAEQAEERGITLEDVAAARDIGKAFVQSDGASVYSRQEGQLCRHQTFRPKTDLTIGATSASA
jgi:hypothetical protein